MLAIGSVAVRGYYPDARGPNDLDIICQDHELNFFLDNFELISEFEDIKFKFKKNKTIFEVENASKIPSSQLVIKLSEKFPTKKLEHQRIWFNISAPAPEILAAIKLSHLPFNINWKKNFLDFRFLQKKGIVVPPILDSLIKTRMQETQTRIKYIEPNFNLPNEKFFTDHVKRVVDHDQLHFVLKYYDRPLFESIKKDLSRAAIDFSLFQALSYKNQLRTIAEEVMVLTSERFLIPKLQRSEPLNIDAFEDFLQSSLQNIASQMCHNFLPIDFRRFAIENYYQILQEIPENFWTKFQDLIKKG